MWMHEISSVHLHIVVIRIKVSACEKGTTQTMESKIRTINSALCWSFSHWHWHTVKPHAWYVRMRSTARILLFSNETMMDQWQWAKRVIPNILHASHAVLSLSLLLLSVVGISINFPALAMRSRSDSQFQDDIIALVIILTPIRWWDKCANLFE